MPVRAPPARVLSRRAGRQAGRALRVGQGPGVLGAATALAQHPVWASRRGGAGALALATGRLARARRQRRASADAAGRAEAARRHAGTWLADGCRPRVHVQRAGRVARDRPVSDKPSAPSRDPHLARVPACSRRAVRDWCARCGTGADGRTPRRTPFLDGDGGTGAGREPAASPRCILSDNPVQPGRPACPACPVSYVRHSRQDLPAGRWKTDVPAERTDCFPRAGRWPLAAGLASVPRVPHDSYAPACLPACLPYAPKRRRFRARPLPTLKLSLAPREGCGGPEARSASWRCGARRLERGTDPGGGQVADVPDHWGALVPDASDRPGIVMSSRRPSGSRQRGAQRARLAQLAQLRPAGLWSLARPRRRSGDV